MSDNLLVLDSGLFTHIAEELAPRFEKTYYYSEWISAFPEGKRVIIGDLPGIERVKNLWEAVDAADFVVSPDVVTGPTASHIRSLGKPVFGTCNEAAELELDRWGFRKVLKEAGLPVGTATRIVGAEDLKKFLKTTKNVYVKHGRYRGDLETFHHEAWFTTEPWFDDLVMRLGPRSDSAEFIAEDSIDGVEVGHDGFCIDGQYPENSALYGYESKDSGYIGRVVGFSSLPDPLREVSKRIASVLKERKHRGFFSTECRITPDGTPYLIDPCIRAGSPPSEGYMNLWSNWAGIVRGGAEGKMVDPVANGSYVAEIILRSEWAVEHFLALDIPSKVKDQVKLHNHAVIEGKDYVVPSGIPQIGAAVGIGSSLDEAIKKAEKAVEAVKAYDLEYNKNVFEELRSMIEEGKACGIGWE